MTLTPLCRKYHSLSRKWPSGTFDLQRLGLLGAKQLGVGLDGWGNPIRFVTSSNAPGSLWLESSGPSGSPGGNSPNAGMVCLVTP
jgi:hypothetical protein